MHNNVYGIGAHLTGQMGGAPEAGSAEGNAFRQILAELIIPSNVKIRINEINFSGFTSGTITLGILRTTGDRPCGIPSKNAHIFRAQSFDTAARESKVFLFTGWKNIHNIDETYALRRHSHASSNPYHSSLKFRFPQGLVISSVETKYPQSLLFYDYSSTPMKVHIISIIWEE